MSRRWFKWVKAILGCLLLWDATGGGGWALAQEGEKRALGAIKPVRFEQLTDRNVAIPGRRALALRPDQWLHSETEHFVIHYRTSAIGTPVAVEAEFYYRVIMQDLQLKPPANSPKHHLFIFEEEPEWKTFVSGVQMEAWTGAAKIGDELFVPRYPHDRIKGHYLGHEIAHLLVERYLGRRLPLWLSEGYADDVALRGYASFYRARGFVAKPITPKLDRLIPFDRFLTITQYLPSEEVTRFYNQSRRLVGFLNRFGDTKRFRDMMAATAKGRPFETALREAYGAKWHSTRALEADFIKEVERFNP